MENMNTEVINIK